MHWCLSNSVHFTEKVDVIDIVHFQRLVCDSITTSAAVLESNLLLHSITFPFESVMLQSSHAKNLAKMALLKKEKKNLPYFPDYESHLFSSFGGT